LPSKLVGASGNEFKSAKSLLGCIRLVNKLSFKRAG
jgi:hypothetical protein